MALARRFGAEDAARFPVDPAQINWPDYLCRVHMGGLNRYALRPRGVSKAAATAAAAAAAPASCQEASVGS